MASAYLIARVCTCLPYVVSSLNWIHILKQYLARFVVKNEDQKDKACYDGIGLGAQIVDTINSRFNCAHRWEDLCDHLKSKRIFTLKTMCLSLINGIGNDNLRDLELLTRSKPILEYPIKCGVGSVPNRATYLSASFY